MKRFLSLLAISAIGAQAYAQDSPIKGMTTPTAATPTKTEDGKTNKAWTKGACFTLSLTQVGNSNWIAASGDKFTLSTFASLNAFATKKWKTWNWDNALEFNYGLVNTSTLGVRKLNDRLDMYTKLTRQPKKWKKASYGAFAQLRTQFSDGYMYDYFGSTEKRRTSGFFAPAYVTIAPLGIDWHPNSWFSLFGTPVALRWTIVSNGPYSYAAQGGLFKGNVETPLATLYSVNPQKQNLGEIGAFVTASIKKEVLKNVYFYSKLDLCNNYLVNWNQQDGHVGFVNLFWKNQFLMKVNKFIQVGYNLDLIYDHNIKNPTSPSTELGLQVLSTLGVGVYAKF